MNKSVIFFIMCKYYCDMWDFIYESVQELMRIVYDLYVWNEKSLMSWLIISMCKQDQFNVGF